MVGEDKFVLDVVLATLTQELRSDSRQHLVSLLTSMDGPSITCVALDETGSIVRHWDSDVPVLSRHRYFDGK